MLLENKYSKLALIAGPVLVLDQITKYIILKTMMLHDSIPVMPGYFSLTHIQNPGGAFGFLAGQSPDVRRMIFIFVSFIALCLIFYLYSTTPRTNSFLATGFAMIFGGAVGSAGLLAALCAFRTAGGLGRGAGSGPVARCGAVLPCRA